MKEGTPFSKRREAVALHGALYDWLDSIVFALIVVMIFNLGFRIVNVSGSSMQPTLATGDRLIISRIGYHPQVGDIVVSIHPNEEEEAVIKRVIALGGQTVDIDFDSGTVLVDGKQIEDAYTLEPGFILPLTDINKPIAFPCTVPEGMVFLLGDNRNNSLDSRSKKIGMAKEEYLLGKAVFRLFPFNRMGGIG